MLYTLLLALPKEKQGMLDRPFLSSGIFLVAWEETAASDASRDDWMLFPGRTARGIMYGMWDE